MQGSRKTYNQKKTQSIENKLKNTEYKRTQKKGEQGIKNQLYK